MKYLFLSICVGVFGTAFLQPMIKESIKDMILYDLQVEGEISATGSISGINLQTSTYPSSPNPNTVYGNSIPLAYGLISSTGNVLQGYGISVVSHPEIGQFDITLNTSVLGYPVAVASPFSTSPDEEIVSINSVENSNTVQVFISKDGAPANSGFFIIIYGTPLLI